ncbi:TM1812 family CRISPR-associated protein [uncultured Dubosiella sp.]|uniref:CRISPR-associated DxTHG motif protein n=1 Tax=uncultured Dubosiella sp. TaxID=1937011 RepID=UPI002730C625|nr:TM1812 family CRISPR-associated protein [uncultured Dubosiella sp.]
MQYSSFVGVGAQKGGYQNLIYTFDGDDETLEEGRFVQVPIYHKHADRIDESLLFFMPESKERYYQDFMDEFHDVKVTPVDIQENISFEDFVTLLAKYMRPDGEVIVDVTHSFRQIPIRMLFALKYVEFLKNIKVEHIYYGKVKNKNQLGIICDSVQDYVYQSVTECLSQFNNTLIIRSKDWEGILENDPKVVRFLDALTDFNEMVELCEFDSSIHAIDQILEASKSLEEEAEKYTLILPLTSSIRRKFEPVYHAQSPREKRKQVILILLAHQRYQNAVTFTDQFLREECVKAVERNGISRDSSYLYNFSQCILERNAPTPKMLKYVERLKTNPNYPRVRGILQQDQGTINKFFNEIRNSMNHGTTIQGGKRKYKALEKQIRAVVRRLLEIIDQL